VDIDMVLQHDRASVSDDLGDTVDYAVITDDVAAIVSGEPVALLERLCMLIAERVMAEQVVRAVTVTVAKPQVAIRHVLDDVSVTLHLERNGA